MVRKLENWITSFRELLAGGTSPEIFKKWGAIATIAGVLERKVWANIGLGPLYPNLYTILVAPPGVGKTVVTSNVRNLWYDLSGTDDSGLRVGAASLTGASLIDELRDSTRRVFSPGNPLEPIRFNALAVCSNEFGVLLPSYDGAMMNVLTDIYDGHGYSERRRWAKKTDDEKGMKIDHPQLNILAATTPGYLSNFLPEGAWDMGFLSRCILVFNGSSGIMPLFANATDQSNKRKALLEDLGHIFKLFGEVSFTDEAKNALIAWHNAGGPPAPDHPRLHNYTTRRTAHLVKLCMVASAAEADDLIVTVENFNDALAWLLEAEQYMPDIFKSMVVNADMKAIDECWHFAYQIWMREQKAVAEHRIVAFLQERVPVQNVMRMLDVMKQAKLLEEQFAEGVGKVYKPKARR